MNKVEKIKDEIDRLQSSTLDENSNFRSQYDQGIFDGLSLLENFINSLEEEPISNDLEEAAVEAFKQIVDSDKNNFLEIFKAGAEWQKERDQSTIELAEDHAMLAGMEKMKQEMMKNVVLETKVMKDNDGDGIDTPYEEWLTLEDTEIPFIPDDIGLKDGDKVKLIIIREEYTMKSNRIYYEFLREINPILPPYEVFDKYKDDIEGLATYMINEHPDKKEEIEKIVKQLIRRE